MGLSCETISTVDVQLTFSNRSIMETFLELVFRVALIDFNDLILIFIDL